MPVRVRFAPLVSVLLLSLTAISLHAQHQDPRAQAIVHAAVQTELAADRDDHSRWQYRDLYRNPDGESLFQVVETDHGSVKKKLKSQRPAPHPRSTPSRRRPHRGLRPRPRPAGQTAQRRRAG